MRKVGVAFGLLLLFGSALAVAYFVSPQVQNIADRVLGTQGDINKIRDRVSPELATSLQGQGLKLGAPSFNSYF